jgi:ubiquitin
MAGRLISKLAQAAIKPKKSSSKARRARNAKEMAEQEGKSKAANAASIAKAGQKAIAPQRVAEVRKGASGVVEKNKKGLKPVSKMSKLEKQEFDFSKLTEGAKRLERDKLVRGEKTEFADFLKVVQRLKVDPKLVGTKRPQNVKEARRKGRKGPVSLAGPKEFGGKGKAYGGKVKKKMGGKVGKPKGVGCATRGYGKAMK